MTLRTRRPMGGYTLADIADWARRDGDGYWVRFRTAYRGDGYWRIRWVR